MSGGIYVTAAFKSVRNNQAYIFMKNECVLDDYAPGSKDDRILYGPDYVGNMFPSLKGSVFADKGIDCAFASQDEGIAFIFSGNQCAKWFYAPNSGNDRFLLGPSPIAEILPFLRGTIFANGVDAAFESTRPFEAYLFKGNQYARINYSTGNGRVITIGQNWACFKGTIFENGFDAAFALHIPNEAYIFKGESYARIKFTPGDTKDKIMWTGNIKSAWRGLGSILPRPNRNLVAN
ncbi:unnamed protein product [Amaranthus hypochondriacus]